MSLMTWLAPAVAVPSMEITGVEVPASSTLKGRRRGVDESLAGAVTSRVKLRAWRLKLGIEDNMLALLEKKRWYLIAMG